MYVELRGLNPQRGDHLRHLRHLRMQPPVLGSSPPADRMRLQGGEDGVPVLLPFGFRVPDRWQREAARIAALLESADADFVSLVEAVESYRGEHGVYLKPDAIRAELALAEQIQKHAPNSFELKERRARLALSLGEWAMAHSII